MKIDPNDGLIKNLDKITNNKTHKLFHEQYCAFEASEKLEKINRLTSDNPFCTPNEPEQLKAEIDELTLMLEELSKRLCDLSEIGVCEKCSSDIVEQYSEADELNECARCLK